MDMWNKSNGFGTNSIWHVVPSLLPQTRCLINLHYLLTKSVAFGELDGRCIACGGIWTIILFIAIFSGTMYRPTKFVLVSRPLGIFGQRWWRQAEGAITEIPSRPRLQCSSARQLSSAEPHGSALISDSAASHCRGNRFCICCWKCLTSRDAHSAARSRAVFSTPLLVFKDGADWHVTTALTTAVTDFNTVNRSIIRENIRCQPSLLLITGG